MAGSPALWTPIVRNAEYDLLRNLQLLALRQLRSRTGVSKDPAVDVVALSLGYYHEQPGDAAFDALLHGPLRLLGRYGAAVVVSAGNDATDRPIYPAAFAPYDRGVVRDSRDVVPVTAVGALNPDGSIALFSNDGPWVAFHRPGASLLLVGDGPRRAWIEQFARDAKLSDAVVLTGFRPDVPALLGAMDCFALASTRTEGVPQALLQAFAVGVPVVATRIGGIPEVVRDGETGLLVSSGSGEALAAAILRVLDDSDAAARRARAARALVERRFSHEASITRLLQLYDELLAR